LSRPDRLEENSPSDFATHYVLLDRDGVINENRPGSVLSTADFRLIENVPEAILTLNGRGYRVLVISNQACVGRGDLAIDELHEIHKYMRDQISLKGGEIDGIYVCPHTDDDNCRCRKPRTGLIDCARRDHGFVASETWMIGDDYRDVQAATDAGCKPGIVCTGKLQLGDTPPGVAVFRDLMEFAMSITSVEYNR